MRRIFRWQATLTLVLMSFFISAFAQTPEPELTATTSAECGQVIENEFSLPYEYHEYLLQLNPGDQLKVNVLPTGEYLFSALELYEPAGNAIAAQYEVEQRPVLESGILSGRGQYKLYVYNYSRSSSGQPSAFEGGRAGVYQLLISCTLKDGTVVSP